jgi:AcrR family transcriptional regulator
MNEPTGTAEALLAAARQLFAKRGYNGTSIRAITRLARVNLGAVTYHFGSKAALHEAVVASLVGPFRERLRAVAAQPGAPLERIERFAREFFDYLNTHPELPRLLIHQLASEQPMPDAALDALRGNHATLVSLIEEGQHDRTIRSGDPRLMALSIGAQPMLLSVMRPVLQEAVSIDRDHSTSWDHLVDSVVHFVRAGLAAQGKASP